MNTTKDSVLSSRQLLFPGIAAHLETLATTLDAIAEPHHSAGQKLAAWIVASDGGRLIIVVCMGNSRRSLLGALMGQAAATYYGLPQVRFFSGGTAPSAFNARTIRALRAIGFEIEPIGEEAPRGEPNLPNPKYRIRWGAAGSGVESIEFSKLYSDPSNPQSGFAALMVCDEANAGCPVVSGAALRLPMPFPDPKAADDTPDEIPRDPATRDALGRLMVGVLVEAGAKLLLA